MNFTLVLLLVTAVLAQRRCGQNEQFTNCGTACEPSCKNPQPTICTMQCIVDVCQCVPGYVRHSNGNCVKPSECTRVARDANYGFKTCASMKCQAGYTCEDHPVPCFMAPCPIEGRCYPNEQ